MAGNFSITVTAVDHATATLKALNKQLEHVQAPAKALHRQMREFAELSGLKTLAEHAKRFGEGAKEVAKRVGDIVAPLAAITGAASVAGMAALVIEWAEFGEKLGFAAQRMGIAAPALHDLDNAARLAGSSAGSLTSGLGSLSEIVHSAAWGQNAEMVNYFAALHINLRNVNGTIKTADELLPDVANAIARLKDPTAQAYVATKLLGSAGADLLPFLRRGAAGVEEYRKEAEKLGHRTQADIDKAKLFSEAWHKLTIAGENLRDQIVVGLAPAFTKLAEQFQVWLTQHPDFAENISRGILRLINVVEGAWPRIEAFFSGVGSGISKVVGYLGGWENATLVVLGVWTLAKFAPLFLVLERIAALAIAATGALLGLGAASKAAVPAAAGPAAAAAGGGAATRLGAGLLGGFMSPAGLALAGIGAWFGLTSLLKPGGVKPVSPQQSEMPPSTQVPEPKQWRWNTPPIGPDHPMTRLAPNPAIPWWSGKLRPGIPTMAATPPLPGYEMPPSVLGPAARGTQSDPVYVRMADLNPFGAGAVGPGVNLGQTMPGLGGMWGQANKLLSLNQRSATVGMEMAKWMMDQFGWSKQGAAGVIGSMIQESGLNPGAVAPGGDTGLWQATEDRKARLFAMAQQMGKPWQDLEVQKAWFKQEMNTPAGRALAAQIKAHPETSAEMFYRTFERTNFHPNDPSADPNAGRNPWEIARRSGNARQFLERYLKDDTAASGDGATGKAEIHVKVDAPPHAKVRAHASGDLWSGAPRIEQAVPAFGL